MPEVVYRTNHGYDPTIRKHMVEPTPYENGSSMSRYAMLRDGFNWYAANRRINEADALNMTAIPGNKCDSDLKICPANVTLGSNVISVMFVPSELKMWVSFEYSSGENFRPACCSVYVAIDMKLWFKA